MVQRRERYEERYNVMNLARGGDNEIYTVMVDRLSRALVEGDIDDGMDDSVISTKSHREKAHILLQHAASSLSQGKKGLSRKSAGTKSHSRQQAADWAKANAASISARGMDRGANSHKFSQANDDSESDESETEQEINSARALLDEAATRLREGGSNLDAGINNILYCRIMEELGLKKKADVPPPKSTSRSSEAKAKAERRASAAAGILPVTQSDDSQATQRAKRREYAASFLAETKHTESASSQKPLLLRNPLAPSDKLVRRHSAMEILRNLQEMPPSTRRLSNPMTPTTQLLESGARPISLSISGSDKHCIGSRQVTSSQKSSDKWNQRPSRQSGASKKDSRPRKNKSSS